MKLLHRQGKLLESNVDLDKTVSLLQHGCQGSS